MRSPLGPTKLLATAALLVAACDDGVDEASSSASGGGGAGGPAATSSSTAFASSTTDATTAGAGGASGDPGWVPAPWGADCSVEVAMRPAEALPPLEWGPCSDGELGCERIVKNWEPYSSGSQAITDVRPTAEGHDLMLYVGLAYPSEVVVLAGDDGVARAAYRISHQTAETDYCGLVLGRLGDEGHWIGKQHVTATSTYVYQPDTAGPDAAQVSSLEDGSQRQDGGSSFFAIELGGDRLQLWDRRTGETHVARGGDGSSLQEPRVTDDAVFYIEYPNLDVLRPTAWAWRAETGDFAVVLGGDGEPAIADVNGDGETLQWIETAPLGPDDDEWAPGTLFTSPYTLAPPDVVPTERWADIPVTPGTTSAMGGGYWAAIGNDWCFYIMRLSDGRRWVVPVPDSGFPNEFVRIAHIDSEYIFFNNAVDMLRLRIDELGEGMPAE